MYKGKTFLAIIPARGGSKGLPRKNIRLLLGKPLIAWTIEQANKSKYLDEIIVNTDSKEIAEVAIKYGGKIPFLRPKELARDETPTSDVIIHTIEYYKQKGITFDYIVLLEATSPLRKEDDIDKAIEIIIQNESKADSLVGVGTIHSDTEHPYGAKIIKKGYIKPFLNNVDFYQRQQLPNIFGIYGGIYISKIDKFYKLKTFYQDKTIPFYVERWQQYEIDDIYDFLCVEAILKHLKDSNEQRS